MRKICPVYDIEVEDTHNFVTTNGIMTHNCFGVPTIGGEVVFDKAYNLNPLVNAFRSRYRPQNQIFWQSLRHRKSRNVCRRENRTRRHSRRDDGFAEFDDEALEKRPTVQVGNPFLEKLLLEACLEAMRLAR